MGKPSISQGSLPFALACEGPDFLLSHTALVMKRFAPKEGEAVNAAPLGPALE